VRRLASNTVAAGAGAATESRVGKIGKDELTHLGESVGALIAELERSRTALETSEAQSRQLAEDKAALERQRIEIARARCEIRAVLDTSNEAMLLLSAQGRAMTVNEPFKTLFGLSLSSVIGAHVDQLGPKMDLVFGADARVGNWVATGLADKQQVLTRIVVQRGLRPRDMDLVSAPMVTSDGEYDGRVYVFRPSEAEGEVERAKSEFVALVSHELRTPLTSIKGYVDIMLGAKAGDLREDQRRFLGIVRRNSERLIALISDLLDMSRIEAGKIQLQRAPMDIEAIIRKVTEACAAEVDSKSQRLTLCLPERLPAVLADTERVEQILTNLLSNALKYTPPEGSIDVSAREEGTRVRILVRDTGVGLTPEEQGKLFTQLDRKSTRLNSSHW
jgi:signal transduction histidine kinase